MRYKFGFITTVLVSCALLLATTMLPARAATTSRVIVGVGDSFTSGEGIKPYEVGTDTTTNTCHRSINSAFPKVTAYLRHAQWRNVACSGAKTADLFRTFKTEAPQVGRTQGATDIVTTIGGNDINATALILNPPTPAQSDALVASLYPKLVDTYKKLKAANPKARIWAVTYPALYDTNYSPGCLLSVERRKDAIYGEKALNNTVVRAARDAGILAVDNYSSTQGHELCTFDPWFNGYVPSDPEESFHPNAQGQAAMGWRVAAYLKLAS